MSKLDLSKSAQVIEAIQRETEAKVAAIYRDAQKTFYQRVYTAGYEQCERDHQLGRFAPPIPPQNGTATK